VVESDLTPVIHSLAQIRDVDRLAAGAGRRSATFEDRFRHGAYGNAASAAEILATLADAKHARLEG